MNKQKTTPSFKESVESITQHRAQQRQVRQEIRLQEGPIEKALRLSSDEAIARAIRNLMHKDELN